MVRRWNWLRGFLVAICGAAVASAQSGGSATAVVDPRVDQILTRLEERQIEDLHAELSWTVADPLEEEEDRQTKRGAIWFRQMKPTGKFLIQLRDKSAAGTRHAIDERHLFDGEWYIMLDSQARQVSRYEVRRPNDTSDPFRLGQGPFPVPFGQKKADILREFEVIRVAPAKDDPADTDHLKLTPRPESASARNYKSVDFWIAQQGEEAGLPIQVKAAKRDGTGRLSSTITVRFEKARLNAGIAPTLFQIETPPGFNETVERLPPPAP